MTVHFFTRAESVVGDSRQRAFQIVDKLQARGVHAVIHRPPAILFSTTPWPQKFFLIIELIRSLAKVKKGDIIYLQRTISNKYFFAIVVMYLFLFRRKMIFDFCDPVYVYNFFRTKLLTRMADAVVVSTHAQVEWAKQFNSNVHLLHISLDLPVYKKFTKDYALPSDPLVIGWVGTAPNHISNLETLASIFEILVQKTKIPFTFVLIGALKSKKVYDLFNAVPGLHVKYIDVLDWSNPESVPQEIQKFDIGVITHGNDSEWNKAKTSFKILEYMACGVATVASAAGELPYIITDGVDGFTAATETEWVEKLDSLLCDRALRQRLGKAGQERIAAGYSFDVLIPRLLEILTALEHESNQ